MTYPPQDEYPKYNTRRAWWLIIGLFIAMLFIPLCARGAELKEYDPSKPKVAWTIFVNHLLTRQVWTDTHGNSLHHETFSLGDATNTLTYNHTNGALSMTIVQLTPRNVRITGSGERLTSAYVTKSVTSITMISFDYDTVPDLLIKQDIVIGTKGFTMDGATIVVDGVPHGNQLRKGNEKNFKKQLAYMATWALWEVHIMEHLGYTPNLPPRKEEM